MIELSPWLITLIGHSLAFPSVFLVLRWTAIAIAVGYALTKRSLSTWIFIAMITGVETGHDWPHFAVHLGIFATIFLRLVKTIVSPLIFATLVSGIAAHGDLRKLGRIGSKAVVYFEVVTTLALALGLVAANIFKPGVGVQMARVTGAAISSQPISGSNLILRAVPENIAKSVAEGEILQVVLFSILFGIALAMVSEAKRRPLFASVESLAETMFKFTNLVMYMAPLGAGAAMAYSVGSTGLGILGSLGKLLITVYVVFVVFILVVLLPIALWFKIPIRNFVQAVSEPFTIAFATANSEAALPKAMEKMSSFGVPSRVAAFVIPMGYSFNLDGAAIYVSIAALFIAQLSGQHLSVVEQFSLLFTLMLTSKGTAGVSRAAIMVLFSTAVSFGLPTEPIFLLLGIDQLLDMGRAGVNVLGNCLAAAVIGRWEPELPEPHHKELDHVETVVQAG